MSHHIFFEFFFDLPDDQMLGEVWMQQIALRVMLEVLINSHYTIFEVSE